MDEYLFGSIFNSVVMLDISLVQFLSCMATSIILGVFMAKVYSYKTKCSKGFFATLALIPLVITMIIIMINGNVGTGVAVAGAFSLIRFRSVPGTAKEISSIFIAMATGITIGMGYIGFAIIFTIIAVIFSLILDVVDFTNAPTQERILNISIPENLNYVDVFDDIFNTYTEKAELVSAKTTNMGSLFKLTYNIELKNKHEEKAFIDELRCRNGNLDIMMSMQSTDYNGL